MEEKIKNIIEILDEFDIQKRKQILVECSSRIGSDEWAREVRELWERMEELNK